MNEPLVAIHNSYEAFSTLDLDASVPSFTQPCMFLGLRGTFAVANREDLVHQAGDAWKIAVTASAL